MNPFGDKAGTVDQSPGNAMAEAPQPAPHSERIMELYRRLGEAEAGLKECAQRIIRLEKRLGDI